MPPSVTFRPEELPYGIRWIARTGDEDALGLCLPATAEHKGYNYCKMNGQLRTLAPKASLTFHVKTGYLSAEHTALRIKKL
ncbi:MAG: hypothetical protein FWF86_08990 [Clostridia bacterium]|nr:hypothetical protein [Clostridia bacterium]